ncbi:MAG: hypothetical protein IPH18_06360 [Chitinophagaceae bacterium]|nr:hypothetical protein [Chitinophagaceae bacterium]
MPNRIILTVAFLGITIAALAQESSVKASISKNRILIGEPVSLNIEIYQSPASVNDKLEIDSIPHFEFIGGPVTDTIDRTNGLRVKSIYKITSFDSGHWVIPSFILAGKFKTDTIGIDVLFSVFNPEQDYHDIKDIIEVKPSGKKNQWWWFLVGGVFLAAILLYYVLRKKKPAVVSAITIKPVDAYAEAMNSMEELQRSHLSVKPYFIRLTDIFRLYIFRKKGIHTLQRTTTDLVLQLKDAGLGKDEFDKLSSSLRLSDFVKFAKYIATEDDRATAFNHVLAAIKSIQAKSIADLETEIKSDA